MFSPVKRAKMMAPCRFNRKFTLSWVGLSGSGLVVASVSVEPSSVAFFSTM